MKTSLTASTAFKSLLTLVISLFTFSVLSANTLNTNGNAASVNPEPVKFQVNETIVARVTDKSVFLNWNTITAAANIHFEVERSSDMNNFKTVALVLDGFTTEGAGKRYAFKENSSIVKSGQAVFYRLKQIDHEGNITFSDVIKVQIDAGVQ